MYENYLNEHGDEGTLTRICKLKSTELDEQVAAAAVLHYDTWTQQQLLGTLD